MFTYSDVEMVARAAARDAVRQGATAPWPSGVPLQQGDAEFLGQNLRPAVRPRELPEGAVREFARAFRAAIDEMAPRSK